MKANHFELEGKKVLVDSNEILFKESVTRLTPKEKEVLLLLYSNRGSTVPRSRILETVWGDSLGNDSGLTQAVSRLRQIFKDNPKEPKVIKTIPKLGYQLLLESEDRAIHQETKWNILANYSNLTEFQKLGVRMLLMLIALIVFLLIFDVRIRIEQLPAISNWHF